MLVNWCFSDIFLKKVCAAYISYCIWPLTINSTRQGYEHTLTLVHLQMTFKLKSIIRIISKVTKISQKILAVDILQVFEAALAWVKRDEYSRQEYLPDLMVKVRLPLLTPQFLSDRVASEELIKSSHKCRCGAKTVCATLVCFSRFCVEVKLVAKGKTLERYVCCLVI